MPCCLHPARVLWEKLGLLPGTEIAIRIEEDKLIVQPAPKILDLLREPAQVQITLEEFHRFRRELSKKAEAL